MAIEGGIRMRMATCPSCGGPLRFQGATSIVAVCPYCRSTLVRDGVKLEDIGKQSDLLPDDTPIQVGTSGRHRGEPFNVVGRIQYRYEAGLWNEWHVLFDRGRSAWLSDASRDYTISYLSPPAEVPAFEALKPGARVTLFGDAYTVTDLENAEVVAGEGELPFRFTAGWKAPVADLRGAGTRFATVDYSESVPHVYVGERLPFDTFQFAGLRDPDLPAGPKGRAIAFKCAGCGAPIEKHVATTLVVACPSCGTVTDVTGTVGEIVQRNEANQRAFARSIPLGAVLRWRGAGYEVVGCMRRRIVVDGQGYSWDEYLLHDVTQGYLWISQYDGHFSVIKAAANEPSPVVRAFESSLAKPRLRYLGHVFEHFQRSEPEVVLLVGEFYWRVRVGDRCRADDYVDPPLILSSEVTESEITWSVGEYVEPEVLWKALGLKTRPPPRKGVAPNQPSPHKGKTFAYWAVCLVFLAAAVMMQFGFMASGRSTPPPSVPFTAAPGETTRVVSPVFMLGGRSGGATVYTWSNVKLAWLDLDMRLVNAETGRAYRLNRQLGFRKLGALQEGYTDDMAEIEDVPPGRYALAIDAKAGATPGRSAFAPVVPIRGYVRIYRSQEGWSNLALLAGFLLLWPLVSWARAAAFERARWAESDYPPSSGSGDDDDDDD